MLKIKEIKAKIGFIGESRQTVLKDLDFAVQNKFDYYEIQAIKKPITKEGLNLDSEIVNQAKKISQENNISLTLHASYFISLCSAIPKISKAALELAEKEITFAHKIGAKKIVIHCGHKDLPEGKGAKNFESLTKNLKELVKLGKKHKIEIGIENGFSIGNLCRKLEDLLRVVNSVKGLRVTFDAGHANAPGFNPIQYFQKVKNFVINIHLHDNDGKSDQHALIGEGNINFKSLLKECKNSNYYGPFILEVFPHKNVLKCRERFLNLWNQI